MLENLDRLHAALEPLSIEERRVALDYLLGAISEAVEPTHWDIATVWAVDFARGIRGQAAAGRQDGAPGEQDGRGTHR